MSFLGTDLSGLADALLTAVKDMVDPFLDDYATYKSKSLLVSDVLGLLSFSLTTFGILGGGFFGALFPLSFLFGYVASVRRAQGESNSSTATTNVTTSYSQAVKELLPAWTSGLSSAYVYRALSTFQRPKAAFMTAVAALSFFALILPRWLFVYDETGEMLDWKELAWEFARSYKSDGVGENDEVNGEKGGDRENKEDGGDDDEQGFVPAEILS
jgi:hypothetical protein